MNTYEPPKEKGDYCGIILAKRYSKRLENKNFLQINGKKMYEHPLNALQETLGAENVVFVSDHPEHNNRPPAACFPEEPIFETIKWAYKSMKRRYKSIVFILANCPQIKAADVKRAINRFEEIGCEELRSFDKSGRESGLIIVKEGYLMKKHEISTYQGGIQINSIEIHNQKDLEKCI